MNVPRLRFPEFKEAWFERKLNEVANKISDGIHSTPTYDENGHYHFVNGNNLTNSKIEFSENTKRVSASEYLKHKSELTIQTILISINGTIGNLALYNNEKIVLGKSACYLNLKPEEIKYFVFNLLQTPKIKNHFEKELTGSTIKNLSLTTIKNAKAFFPTYKEQTKIANFLTAIDEKITQLTQKYDLLKQYKKGVMQQILSQKLRFKDDDDSELRIGKLKDFGYFYYGKSAPKSSITDDAKTPCVRYGELYSTYRECIKKIKSYTNISPDNLKFSKGGEVLIPRVGEDPMDFANCSYLPIANVAIGEMISVYNTKENGLFLTYYINTMLKKQLAKFVEGGSVSNLYFRYLEDIEITIPHLEEQTKIANFLTAIDDKIIHTKTQLDAVKLYKKGLLQQLFI